ncbi:hypothetical protein EYF80_010092 [Liparis tanakae]|uniref:Uncharacterized protein n=1 Tax=Liparis tanakae TaxID=230148 RepID=A0A4Z2IPW4_9TELE|nr:hypothetical protein EYF80_010092 [Liparis tanakae]
MGCSLNQEVAHPHLHHVGTILSLTPVAAWSEIGGGGAHVELIHREVCPSVFSENPGKQEQRARPASSVHCCLQGPLSARHEGRTCELRDCAAVISLG